MTHIDLMNYYHQAPVEPDRETAAAAWEKLKTLRLKPKHLEILRLFYKEGKRLCDCALELKIPDQTAWARKKKAEEQVADRLKRLEFWKKIRFYRFDRYWPMSFKIYRTIATLYFKKLHSTTEICNIVGYRREGVNRAIAKIRKSFG